MNAQFVVLTNAVPGQEAEFDRWYDTIHIGEVCAVPGVVSAARSSAAGGSAAFRSCAIYQIDAADPDAVVTEIYRRYAKGEMVTTAAMADEMLTALYFHGATFP